MNEQERTALLEQCKDPVVKEQIVSRFRRIDSEETASRQLVELSKSYKRIDPSFAKMEKADGMPVFAVMDYATYRSEAANRSKRCGAIWDPLWGRFSRTDAKWSNTRTEGPKHPNEHELSKKHLESGEDARPFVAYPHSPVPDAVDAAVKAAKDRFPHIDCVEVAWEARWEKEAPMPKDPIVLAYAHGCCFVLAKWDMTSIESYVTSGEFTP